MEELMLVNPLYEDWLEDDEDEDMDMDLLPSYVKPKARRRNPPEGGSTGFGLLALIAGGYLLWCLMQYAKTNKWNWTPWQAHQLARPPVPQLTAPTLPARHPGDPILYDGAPGDQPIIVIVT